MEKNDILERYRAQKSDEGMDAAVGRGRMLGMRICEAACLLLSLISIAAGAGAVYSAIVTLIFLMWACEGYAKYIFSRKRAYLLAILVCVFYAVLCFFEFLNKLNLW